MGLGQVTGYVTVRYVWMEADSKHRYKDDLLLSCVDCNSLGLQYLVLFCHLSQQVDPELANLVPIRQCHSREKLASRSGVRLIMLFNGSYILYCGRVFMQEASIPCYTPPKQISLSKFLYGMQIHSSFSPC